MKLHNWKEDSKMIKNKNKMNVLEMQFSKELSQGGGY